MIPGKGDLHDYGRSISTYGDFLGPTPSYTLIKDPVLRLCHRMIAHSIVSRSQAPEKVTVTNLFYLRGLDVGLVNIPYLLARYLRRFTAGRKSEAHISGGQFVARLAKHFRLLTVEILGGLTVIATELSIIDMERQSDAVASGPKAVENALADDQAKQREVIGTMARDFLRFIIWAADGIYQLLDSARVTYTPYYETRIPYQRHVRHRTGEASTSTAQQDQQQLDP
nr:hypothetical protein [Tanacetum cinerariifolium]